nr:RNA-directed DNA polymerase, eukaryota [Tanacetum cinerariifolium]
YISDNEGLQNSVRQSVGSEPVEEGLFNSDEEGVHDTIFEDTIVSPIKSVCHSSGKEGEHISEDPFGIYEMLNRNPTHVAKELDPSLSHPLGFTLVEPQQEETNGGDKELPNSADPSVLNNFEVPTNESCNGKSDDISSPNSANGGLFLEVLDGLVCVGQSMGYKMDGCLKDLENIIGNHGDSNSGGILCIWEASVFKKEFVTVSDNFKNLQALKTIIRRWIKSKNLAQSGIINSIKKELIEIDKIIDSGSVNDDLLLKRMDLSRQLFNTKHVDSCDSAKDVFKQHFAARFKKPNSSHFKLNFVFPNQLSDEQVKNMDRLISRDEIKNAVWSCGENKSSGPDGYTFEFFRQYWNFIGPDLCSAVECFFDKGSFPMGNNASFIALIPKVLDAKYVTDYRPISLIGSVYKVITKVLANRLAMVVSDLVSDTQSAFVVNHQILDGPFILNEVLTWCKRKRKQAMIFKVDFAKTYDSVRWDYLME